MEHETRMGRAAEGFARMLGTHVVIYYIDTHGNPRTVLGFIEAAEGDILWLTNTNRRTGKFWRGGFNCAKNTITLISLMDGWGDGLQEGAGS